MHHVRLSGQLRSAADNLEVVEIHADTIRELLFNIAERYPQLDAHIAEGIAVSIDGEIYRDNWNTKIPAGSEVFLLPRIPGG